jgi:hypothetical protein
VGDAPPRPEIDAAGLGQQHLQIGLETAVDDQPREQRPCLHPVQIGKPR